jgi:8-oxo-dGTP pyrophosphatase MutT (NUDIX family)
MKMKIRTDDPRLTAPQCTSLIPIEIIHENQWFTVRNRGGFFTTEYLYPQVIILPIVENHSIVMVRVKRPIIADVPLELPAGSAIENESPLQAAARELFEETGIEIHNLDRFKKLGPIAGAPNRNPILLNIFKIDISLSEFNNRKYHDSEVESVAMYKFEKVCSFLMEGDVYVAAPIAVIARYLLSLKNQ